MSTLLTIGTVWLLVSFAAGIMCALAGRRIFRKPPAPPQVTIHDMIRAGDVDGVVAELKRRERMRGGL